MALYGCNCESAHLSYSSMHLSMMEMCVICLNFAFERDEEKHFSPTHNKLSWMQQGETIRASDCYT